MQKAVADASAQVAKPDNKPAFLKAAKPKESEGGGSELASMLGLNDDKQ